MKHIATLTRTREILNKYGLSPKKGYGQNFIIDPGVVKKIAQASCHADLTTIEIGPGIGALTEWLLNYSYKVIAYEIDDKLIDVLNENFGEYDNFTLINGDFLKADLSNINDECVVCANLPYYITTPILFKLFESGIKFKSINVMMQKEVGDRLLARCNMASYSALSVVVGHRYDVKTLMKVPKEVFNPKPKVDSIVLTLTPKKLEVDFDVLGFGEFVRNCFNYRRKTLINNLKNFLAVEVIDELNMQFNFGQKRPQELSVEEFVEVYKSYENTRIR
ncbi:MAG: 16S rRNA (adenine(1518)-N(6)/adenine(1519)-N(6))-dimethyltransferase RsmA [Erysipelotrichaceae bacterium]|nr:16S rRNA (adenine(1518)-N(6)/adenine(1519)-N(6))-dimethyltransferase RsmA [Erysipelotrichaceae bacterium]